MSHKNERLSDSKASKSLPLRVQDRLCSVCADACTEVTWPHTAHRSREPYSDEAVQAAALETSLRTNITFSGTPKKAVCVTGRATAKHVPRCPPPNACRLACLCQSVCGRLQQPQNLLHLPLTIRLVERAHVPASALGIESLTCRV